MSDILFVFDQNSIGIGAARHCFGENFIRQKFGKLPVKSHIVGAERIIHIDVDSLILVISSLIDDTVAVGSEKYSK